MPNGSPEVINKRGAVVAHESRGPRSRCTVPHLGQSLEGSRRVAYLSMTRRAHVSRTVPESSSTQALDHNPPPAYLILPSSALGELHPIAF